MRLLHVTNQYYLTLLIFLLLAWSAYLYLILRFEVYDNIDEVLTYRNKILIEKIIKEDKLPLPDNYHDFVISPVREIPLKNISTFEDTLLYKSKTGYDEYRRMTSYFKLNGQPYRVNSILPHLEQDEMLNTLLYTLPVFIVMFLVGYWIMVNLLNRKIWNPFYRVLHQFKTFRLESNEKAIFAYTSIREFRELQEGFNVLVERATASYLQQKQFTENASHEIQTPLAIIHAKLELLSQDVLNKKQSSIMEETFKAVDRLSKINETLLLLTKIDNYQFTEREEIRINPLVNEIVLFFEEMSIKYNLNVSIQICDDEVINCNQSLLSILLTNLLKNAFIHNVPNGIVEITLANKIITILNSGEPHEVSQEKLFDRFYTQSPGKGGVGLGLAIVKSICAVNNWKINYQQESVVLNKSAIHRFSIYVDSLAIH